MAHFYEALRQKRGLAGSADALRAAQLAGLRPADGMPEPRHPFFWAGFQIVGGG
jgi:CHAT domain-containing protein